MENVKMPFGKYKDKTIKEISELEHSNNTSGGVMRYTYGKDYLTWAIANIAFKDKKVIEAINFYNQGYVTCKDIKTMVNGKWENSYKELPPKLEEKKQKFAFVEDN